MFYTSLFCDSCPSFTPWTSAQKMPSLNYLANTVMHTNAHIQPNRCRSIPLYISTCNNLVLVHLLSVWHSYQNISSICVGPESLLSSLGPGIMPGPQAPCSQKKKKKKNLSMFLKTQCLVFHYYQPSKCLSCWLNSYTCTQWNNVRLLK